MKRIPQRTKSVYAGITGADIPDLIPTTALITHTSRGQNRAACCTLHKIALDRNGKPKLMPGVIANLESLESALHEAKHANSGEKMPRQAHGFMSRDVIFKSPSQVAWLRPASVETILVGGQLNASYNRKRMAVPEMIFCVMGGRLLTLCPLSAGRPGPETEVCAAPFPNTAPEGGVCLNGGLTFESDIPGFMDKVENLYFNTTFTHPNLAHPINSDAQLRELWEKAIERAANGEALIPSDFLTPKYPKFKLKEALKHES
jgi:PRTRC genetic system protein B